MASGRRAKERILRFGRKDNFWQMGETGPCGPCSEIHYYMGDDPSDAENCAANVNGPSDIITELWNLVFMQFDRSEVVSEPPAVAGGPVGGGAKQYKLTPLPAPSVDTGMGLERLCVVLQGVKSNYETDLLKNIVEFVAKLARRPYEYEPIWLCHARDCRSCLARIPTADFQLPTPSRRPARLASRPASACRRRMDR